MPSDRLIARPPDGPSDGRVTAPPRSGAFMTGRWDRWRPGLHIAVLLLILAGSATLAIETYLSHRSFAERSREASRALAYEAAANLSRSAESRLNYAVGLYFTPVASRLEYDTPARRADFSRMALEPPREGCVTPALCAGGPARTTFHYDLRSEEWTTTGAAIDPLAAKAIRDSIRDEALNRYKPSWQLAVLSVPLAGKQHIVLYRLAFDTGGKPATVNGLELDMPRVGRDMFTRTVAQLPLLASARARTQPDPSADWPVGKENEKLFSIRIVSPDSLEYLRAGLSPDVAPVLAQYPMTGGLGQYRVDIGLGPDLRAAAASGADHARLVRASLAFTASVLLIALAIAQTRREYALARLRESFVASVSHELRTPLAQIRLYSEMMQLGFVRNVGEHNTAVDVIVQEAGRLTYLIENVLTYSRASRGELRLEPARVDVASVLEEVRRMEGPLVTVAGLTLRTSSEPGLVASADRAALLQVLVNLIDNAIRHATGTKDIVVTAEGTQGRVRFLVDDAGPGIPRRDRDRIWQRFVRLEGRTRSTGSGIGLAVVAELVVAMGGHAWVTDSPIGGARFVVEVPSGMGLAIQPPLAVAQLSS
ncbi:MAG TPA: HAMP domain-containing sensor histidine kinase [Gemmatimonadaceae bacterium]|nr:HAMP domain-containing sensor histidine kinase [Gemmatimonadaceae bacterium]